jgi:histidyl-tRNA synthetase
VWRADRPAKGRFREFYQCDIDAIGTRSTLVDVELLTAASDVLTTLGFGDFRIRLNDRRLLSALLETAGVPATLAEDALVAIDKRDKIGRAGVVTELGTRGVPTPIAERLLDLLTPQDGGRGVGAVDSGSRENAWMIDHLEREIGSHVAGRQALDDLKAILTLARGTSADTYLAIDPSLARGLSYYTGAIMEVAVSDLAGSLGGGGRYDHLIGMFLGREIPACGFSLGLERIIVVMTERNMFPPGVVGGAVDVMVTVWSHETRDQSLALASELRRAGLRVDVYPEADKLGKQFKYASSRDVSFVAVIGDDERATETVSIKDMRSGVQETVRRDFIVDHIRRQLSQTSKDS